MPDFKIGDEVLVFRHTHTRHGRNPDEPITAKVVKVARKYATAEWQVQRPAGPVTATAEFDMTTGNERGFQRFGYYVRTPEQVDLDKRRSAALAAIKAHHIEIKLGHENGFPLERLEALAEVVKTWEA